MFCSECGVQINDKAVVCPKCGVSVTGKKIAPASNVAVPNHMVWAILSTVFCCLIGGIVSIVYASRVNTKLAQGDLAGAQAASKSALHWIIGNVIVGLIVFVLPILIAAFSPAISSAKQSANSSAAAMRGRNLFVAMTQANVEREAAGLPGVWPQTEGSPNLTDDKNDIAGNVFKNSTDYFKALFDMASYGKDGWAPYVSVDMGVLKISEDSKNDFCDWIVAANLQEEFDDVVPVLISANVDPSVLKTSFDGDDDTPIAFGSKVGRAQLPWCDKFVIVVRKGGRDRCHQGEEFHLFYAIQQTIVFGSGIEIS